jgi:diacylglycerol O-acyltransferase
MSRPGVDISLAPVNLPLNITNPSELLARVRTVTESTKRAHMARLFSLWSACLSALPGAAKPFAGWLLSNPLPVLPWNVISTNVPGPKEPLYLLGRKMLSCYPYLPIIPLGDEMGLSCAVYSYNGQLYCGFAGDVVAMPDVDRLRQFFDLGFAELISAALGGSNSPSTGRKRRARSAA